MEMIPDSFHFNLKILDCNEIENICLLNIQNTDLPNALFDYSKVNVSLVCRTNVFYDVKKEFKCCNNVYLELNRINKMKCLIISSIESALIVLFDLLSEYDGIISYAFTSFDASSI